MRVQCSRNAVLVHPRTSTTTPRPRKVPPENRLPPAANGKIRRTTQIAAWYAAARSTTVCTESDLAARPQQDLNLLSDSMDRYDHETFWCQVRALKSTELWLIPSIVGPNSIPPAAKVRQSQISVENYDLPWSVLSGTSQARESIFPTITDRVQLLADFFNTSALSGQEVDCADLRERPIVPFFKGAVRSDRANPNAPTAERSSA